MIEVVSLFIPANACELKVRRKLFTFIVINKMDEEDVSEYKRTEECVINTSISSHGLVSKKE